MNCKQGDLAVVVNAPANRQEFLGRIYRCVAFTMTELNHPAWEVEGNVVSENGGRTRCIEDMFLMPLDAPLNEDETITDEELTCTD